MPSSISSSQTFIKSSRAHLCARIKKLENIKVCLLQQRICIEFCFCTKPVYNNTI